MRPYRQRRRLFFAPPGAVGDLKQLVLDMRPIEKDISVTEAVGLEQSFDHLQAMAVSRQFAGHLQHGFCSFIPAHERGDRKAVGIMRAERRVRD